MSKKYLFVVNPAAGLNGRALTLLEESRAIIDSHNIDYQVAYTERRGHAKELIEQRIDDENQWVIFACGGDGTLNEIVNAVVARENVTVAHFTSGTGNDFIRMFGKESIPLFSNISELINGETHTFDIIDTGSMYGLNTCSYGFDARAAYFMQKFRWAKVLGSKMPYNIGVIATLLGGIAKPVDIVIDGEHFAEKFTIASIMNGRFYGGGYNPTPQALPNDGLLDVLIIKKINVFQLATMIGLFAKGDIATKPDICIIRRAKQVTMKTPKPDVAQIDGEICTLDRLDLKISNYKLNFILPKGVYDRFMAKN